MPDTLTSIMTFYRDKEPSRFSRYIGMGQIGKPCDRELWLTFHWAAKETIEGRIKRLMERGLREEPVLIADLKAIGCVINTHDTEGKQVFMRGEGLLGHLVGARDIKVESGLPEHPENPVVIDFKSANTKNFKKMLEHGVASEHPEYITQVNAYCGYSDVWIGAILVVCKDDDKMFIEFLVYDLFQFEQMRTKATQIIEAQSPPERKFYRDDYKTPCKFCKNQKVCYGDAFAEVNCRTCIHSTPIEDGTWTCEYGEKLTNEKQKIGCQRHLYIPELLPGFEAISGDDESITYIERSTKKTMINKTELTDREGFTSKDLFEGGYESTVLSI